MSQRLSDPQLIASAIDTLIPLLRVKFAEDGLDDQEKHLLHYLTAVSDRALHVAERSDLAVSIQRTGFNERNLRRIRDISAIEPPAIPSLVEFPRLTASGPEAA